MTLLKESYLHHLLLLLLAAYEDSGLHRLAVRAGAWCGGQIDGSALLRPLCREGVLARSWPCSGACRLLSWIVNLPGRLLRRFYLLLEETFADSFFARLVFRLGDETAVAEGCQAVVTGELGYHRVLAAVEAGCAVILLGHDVSELPYARLLAASVAERQDSVPVVTLAEQAHWRICLDPRSIGR